ncbi:MAG: hypothetical protein AB7L17_07030 [Ilumatobacteraceae bacterium]
MTRATSRRLPHGILALLVPFALVAAACGGDDDLSSAVDQAEDTGNDAADVTLPGGVTLPDGVTIPDLDDVTIPDMSDISIPDNVPITEECRDLYQRFISAMSGVTTGQGLDGFEEAFDALGDTLPSELQDDAQIVSDAYGQMAEVLDEHGGDLAAAMADPATQEKLAAIGTPEVTAALDAIGEYFDETCPELGS